MEQAYHTEAALVLASGGQDSTTCLVWARNNFRAVHAIGFDYGQKHVRETAVAREICAELGVDYRLVDISFIKELVCSNLFADAPAISGSHVQSPGVPSSFVPYRNLLFLTIAAAWAGTLGVRHIVTGVCEADYSGYADCRDVFIKSAQTTLNLATDFAARGMVIHTPLMWLTKAEEFRMAEELGCLDLILQKTLTCYYGVETMQNFGKGCGACPACILRQKGYAAYLEKYRSRDAG